jgi:hypothetical protein
VCTGRDQNTSDGEIDRIFQNNHTRDKLVAELGLSFRAECKNTSVKADQQTITQFHTKVKNSGSRFGVFFSRSGFTGLDSKHTSSCREALKNARNLDTIYILPVTDDNIRSVVEDGRSFVDVLWDSYNLVCVLGAFPITVSWIFQAEK